MPEEQTLSFGPFRLDLPNRQLWRGNRAVQLTNKAFGVLCYLINRSGRLATKEDLFRVVWPEVIVSDGALAVCIRELRKALRDNAKSPRYIETVHGRGFRFVGQVHSSRFTVPSALAISRLVGREMELGQLHGWLTKALAGQHQLVFVTGEAGIGKTALVDAFLLGIGGQGLGVGSSSPQAPIPNPQAPSLWIGYGQCIEQYGAGEAYRPVLEALGRLCRGPDGKRLLDLLEKHAPTWLVQMPTLLSDARLKTLQSKTQGATKDRMLREMAEAVEALTAESPLVLVLEDLHWSDHSTLELLALLARRREPARLLVIGTYRPIEVIVKEHPLKDLKQELHIHEHCEELALGYLSATDIEAYLTQRFAVGATGRSPLHSLARLIYHHTDGTPLFMVNMVDYLISQDVLRQDEGRWTLHTTLEAVEIGVPYSLRQLIETQIDKLPPEEQRLLEVGSVAGVEFSAAAVAAGLEANAMEIEERCNALSRRLQMVQLTGADEWPDGTVTARYGFQHALYHNVLYDRVTAGRRVHLHRQIGEREEIAYGERAGEIAAELAVHFEQGRDYKRAVHYLGQAAQNAIRRSAHQETVGLLTRGLGLLKLLPATPERTQQELALQVPLGAALMAAKGYSAPEVGDHFAQVRELCRRLGETPQLFPTLWGLWAFYLVKGDLRTTLELAEQLIRLAYKGKDPLLIPDAHVNMGITLFNRGEFSLAREHLEQGITLSDPQEFGPPAFRYNMYHRVALLCWAPLVWWCLGYPDQAAKRNHEALTLAEQLAHPFTLIYCLNSALSFYQFVQGSRAVQEHAERMIALCHEHRAPLFLARGHHLRGWALARQGQEEEGIALMQRGLAEHKAGGASTHRQWFLALLAETHGKEGRPEEGLALLADAFSLVNNNEERWWEAELHRLKGTLTLQKFQVPGSKFQVANPQPPIPNPQVEAEACFQRAIDISRHQQAKSLELRAVMSLVRLRQQQATHHAPRNTHHETRGKLAEAHQMLSELYGWFTEGFDTKDLQDAKALLEELA
jgi:DNA-binding winged helix-turn-helix (wHTH) protein/predicted ATPase